MRAIAGRMVSAAIGLLVAAGSVRGADNVWTGAASAHWSGAGNWTNPTSWQAGDVAVFQEGGVPYLAWSNGTGGNTSPLHGMRFEAPGFHIAPQDLWTVIPLVDGGPNSLAPGEFRTDFDAVVGGRFQSSVGLRKTGSGTLTLGDQAFSHSFSGDVVVAEGELKLALAWNSNAGVIGLPTHQFLLDGDLTLEYLPFYHPTQPRVFNEATVGPGRVSKTGLGHVAVNGDSLRHSGGTYVNEGGLTVGTTAGTVSGDFINSALLTLSGTMNYSGQITGPGDVSVVGSVRLANDNNPGGPTTINGRVIIGDGASSGSLGGAVILPQASSTLEFDRADTVEYSQNVYGVGKVVTSGSGTVVFQNHQLGTGELAVRNGTAVLTSIPTSRLLTVDTGGRLELPQFPGGFNLGFLGGSSTLVALRGRGTIEGQVVVPAGREIRPGAYDSAHAAGTLLVEGDVRYLPNAKGGLGVYIRGPSDTDAHRTRLQVTGELLAESMTVNVVREIGVSLTEPALYTIAEASELIFPALQHSASYKLVGPASTVDFSPQLRMTTSNFQVGDVLTLRRTGNALQLALVPNNAVGDFDGDGIVNHVDLATWSQRFGTVDSPVGRQGDADGDSNVDGSDFLLWQRRSTGAVLPLAAVPEPSGGGMACLTAMTIVFRRLRSTVARRAREANPQ